MKARETRAHLAHPRDPSWPAPRAARETGCEECSSRPPLLCLEGGREGGRVREREGGRRREGRGRGKEEGGREG